MKSGLRCLYATLSSKFEPCITLPGPLHWPSSLKGKPKEGKCFGNSKNLILKFITKIISSEKLHKKKINSSREKARKLLLQAKRHYLNLIISPSTTREINKTIDYQILPVVSSAQNRTRNLEHLHHAALMTTGFAQSFRYELKSKKFTKKWMTSSGLRGFPKKIFL